MYDGETGPSPSSSQRTLGIMSVLYYQMYVIEKAIICQQSVLFKDFLPCK